MNFNPDIIEELTGMQNAGLLSEEQEKLLQQLIAENEDAYRFWKELQEEYAALPAAEEWNKYNESAVLAKVHKNIGSGRSKIIRMRWLLSTAAAVTILAVALLFFVHISNKVHQPGDLAANTSIKPGSIQLLMPDGQSVDLSSTKGRVTIGNATLHNNNKVLSYTSSGQPLSGTATLKVPVGKDYKLQLSDGSEIWLNSATVLSFPFTFGNSREITINGEAYVKVVADAKKPFIVHLSASTVQVLGTEFNINTYDHGQEKVSLVAGAVKINAGTGTALLKPGTEAVYSIGTGIKTQPFDEDLTLSWRQGIYKFQSKTLQEICQVLPRWFGIEVVMDNPRIGGIIFSGLLDRNRPLSQQLQLFAADDVHFYFKDGVLHFK
jgi:ferric-dicitrate binding protein FerR (iron transport regulator)